MNSKLQFLRLEDITVNIKISPKEIPNLPVKVSKIWQDILVITNKVERKKQTINIWKKYMNMLLPKVIENLEKKLDNIELLESEKNGEKNYSILYTIKDEDGRTFYYIGQLPEIIDEYNSHINKWKDLPLSIREFYENIHNGFYHYNNRGMGLQPIKFTSFEEEDGGEWELMYDEVSEGFCINNIAFYRNNLGLAISIDINNCDENNSTVWRVDTLPKVGIKFWDIVDQLLLFF